MKLNFRHLALAATALMAIATGASGQDYPSKPVKIIVGYVPGGGPDFVARTFGQRLSEILGQPSPQSEKVRAGGQSRQGSCE